VVNGFCLRPNPVSRKFLSRSREIYANAALTSQFVHPVLLSFSVLDNFKLKDHGGLSPQESIKEG
jgi:hypothetical protein